MIFCYSFFGIAIGLLNGFFGSGGGILAVALLEKKGLSPRQAHATSIALILPLSIISLGVYYLRGNLSLGQSLFFFVPALLGSVWRRMVLKKDSCFSAENQFFHSDFVQRRKNPAHIKEKILMDFLYSLSLLYFFPLW